MRSVLILVSFCAACGSSPPPAGPGAAAPAAGSAHEASAATADAATAAALVERFASDDWPTVARAAGELERRPDALPILFSLLDRTDRAPLRDTADLIYPGAKAFAGHGVVIAYDLDSIAGRAGWLIEERAFARFGFESTPFAQRAELPRPVEAIARARAWYASNYGCQVLGGTPRTEATGRLDRGRRPRENTKRSVDGGPPPRDSTYRWLLEALGSSDEGRVVRALQWLRFPSFPCPGLDAAAWRRDVAPRVERAASSPNAEVARIARLLLGEGSTRALAAGAER